MPDGIALIQAKGGSSVNTVPADAFVEVDANRTGTMGARLVKLARELQKLDREFLNFEDSAFSPSHPTLNIGLLDTREDHLWLSVSVRVTPNINQAQLDNWLERMKKMADEVSGVCIPQRLSPAALTPLNSALVMGAQEILRHLALPDKPIT